jgi:hypothetical protein
MFSFSRPIYLRVGSICALVVAACSTYLAYLLLFDAIENPGDRAGTMLKVGFGVLLILASVLMLTASITVWRSSKFPSKKLSN